MNRARILIVDDHELFRDSLAALISLEPDLEVVGLAGDGFEALQRVRDLQPHLTLMDISMPICNGIEATRFIRAEFPAAKILMLSISQDENHLFEALAAGAIGFLQKDSSKTVFLGAIRQVLDGHSPLSPRQATSVLRALRQAMEQLEHSTTAKDDSNITLREREVLELIVTGASNEEIAGQLSVSLFTVKSHVHSILHKLNAGNRREAGKIALQRGLISKPG